MSKKSSEKLKIGEEKQNTEAGKVRENRIKSILKLVSEWKIREAK